MIYRNTSLVNMARVIEHNLKASVEMAEAFKEFFGVGKQNRCANDGAKTVVERKLEEVGGRYGKRKAEEVDGDTEAGGEEERETKKLKTEDE